MANNKQAIEAGQPLRLHELNIQSLAEELYNQGIRFKNGKRVGALYDENREPYFVGLHKGQRQVVENAARFKVIAAGRRYGKSAVATLTALAALFQPNRRIWIVGPEYAHVEKIFQELYYILVVQLKVAGKDVKNSAARKSKGDYYIELPWGSIVEGKSGTNPDSMAGEALDLVIFDEAALEPNLETIWSQMLRPTLGDKQGSALFISTVRGKNDFYKLFKLGELGRRQSEGYVKIDGPEKDFRDWASWAMPTYVNPFIPREEYDNAKKEALMKGKFLLFKQEYDADFESVSDASFPEFKATIPDEKDPSIRIPYHVQDYRFNPEFGPWFAACDFNIARPASTIYAQIDKEGNLMIFDELFRPGTNAFVQAEFILEKCKELGCMYTQVIGDVSGSYTTAKGMNEFDHFEKVLGHPPEGIRQGRETGNHLIHEWLAYPIIDRNGELVKDENDNPKTYPKLFVASHCTETIHALETAKRKIMTNGTVKQDYQEFTTGHEGLIDSLRYLMVFLFKGKEKTAVQQGIY